MTKAIASYPDWQRPAVVARRMRQYNPNGPNGMGVLAAKAQNDRDQAKIQRENDARLFDNARKKAGRKIQPTGDES